ncbi:SRPBCC family protein [uncultured Croceitalea sp.]|uniref:SRPBCC family protein n=1 Tax=uncultured Croceitalea sp. TaxID=1798908 RepID=UPI003305F3D0
METVNGSISPDNNFGQATMLIRNPVSEVFDAFIDPEKTAKFWFTKSTGRLEEGKSVDWIWEMYNLSVPVEVTKITENEVIQIEWGEGSNLSSVEWTFKAIEENKTFVTITNNGLQGQGDELINNVRDSTGGFTIVLAGLKAFLEHGIELNLIEDKFPKLRL